MQKKATYSCSRERREFYMGFSVFTKSLSIQHPWKPYYLWFLLQGRMSLEIQYLKYCFRGKTINRLLRTTKAALHTKLTLFSFNYNSRKFLCWGRTQQPRKYYWQPDVPKLILWKYISSSRNSSSSKKKVWEIPS